MPDIRFSIVIATYNQEGFIREAVESVLRQTHPDKEVIVVDDNSSDGTAAILKTFGDSITLSVLPKNSGVYASRNKGASLARGEYIVFLDGDDVLMPRALDVYDGCINTRSPKIIIGKVIIFNGKVPEAGTTGVPENISFVEYPDFFSKDRPAIYNTSALIVNRSSFQAAGGWTQGIFYQDIQDLLTKMGTAGKLIIILDPATVWYRMHSSNAVHKVHLFVEGIFRLLEKEKSGLYPGGRERRIERFCWYGGLIYYWSKLAILNGHYRDGFRLISRGWWMVLLSSLRRSMGYMTGRKPVEKLKFK